MSLIFATQLVAVAAIPSAIATVGLLTGAIITAR